MWAKANAGVRTPSSNARRFICSFVSAYSGELGPVKAAPAASSAATTSTPARSS